MLRRTCLLFMILFPMILSLPAAEQEITHRVTGLFSPVREADLRAAVTNLAGVSIVRADFPHAEVVFRYDPVVAFKGTKPEKLVERFNDALRSASHHTLGIAPLLATPHDKLTRVEFSVGGCDCKACNLAAYESISKIDGVAQATASFKEGRITALIDTNQTDRAALEAALRKREVTLKKP